MEKRAGRLKKLVAVQEQVKALHETRRAAALAAARRADEEAAELVAHFNAGSQAATLFPDIYHRRISEALARRDEQRRLAEAEAGRIAQASLRADAASRAYEDERRKDERRQQEHEGLEAVERMIGRAN